MGVIAIVRNNETTDKDGKSIAEIKAEIRKDELVFAEQYRPAGVDSRPINGDIVALLKREESGAWAAVGYLDTVNETVTEPGEWRVNGRKSSDGEILSYLYLNQDGEIVIRSEKTNGYITINKNKEILVENDSGASVKLKDGAIEIMGDSDFAVRFSELETAFNQLKDDFDNHTHQVTGVQAGAGSVVSNAPLAPSTADISGAKIDEIKVP